MELWNNSILEKNREITIKAIEKWRSQLPLSELSTSTRSFYLTLQNTHRTPLSPQTRLEILGLLQPTLGYICTTLQKFYCDSEVLNEHQRSISDLVYVLHVEMIHGYKLVIQNVNKSLFGNKRILLLALQKAMHYCTKILFAAYEKHYHPPNGIWLEFNNLFECSLKKRLAYKSFPQRSDWISRFNCLADIYKHALLFSISLPHQLRREEIAKLLYAIEAWVPLLNIRQIKHKVESLFIIDIHSDTGPKYRSLTSLSSNSHHYLGLDLDKVNDRLYKLMSLQKTNNKKLIKIFSAPELDLPTSYVELLINSWQSVRERIYEREAVHGYLIACLGIAASHWFINQESNSSNLEPATKTPITEPKLKTEFLPKPPNEQPMDNNHDLANIFGEENKKPHYKQYHCELIDQSRGGYRLKWPKDIPTQLQSGEIIALKKPEGSTYSIGTVRWIVQETNDSILIGVQLLSSEALAVNAKITNSTNVQPVPTLLLAAQPTKPLTLITPSLPFKTGIEIELFYNNQMYSASLQKRYSLSPSYQEFGLEFLFQNLVFPSKEKEKEKEVEQSKKL